MAAMSIQAFITAHPFININNSVLAEGLKTVQTGNFVANTPANQAPKNRRVEAVPTIGCIITNLTDDLSVPP
jgi:hypothetical protein